jgi:hypothetical protein
LTEEQNLQLAQIDRFDGLARAVIEQLARLPLRSESGRPFRILSLDGGGIRGAFTAAVLHYWEKATRLKTADHFDLIAGTSTRRKPQLSRPARVRRIMPFPAHGQASTASVVPDSSAASRIAYSETTFGPGRREPTV